MGCSDRAVENHEIPVEYFVELVLPSEEQKKIRTIENQGNLIFLFLFVCFYSTYIQ